MIGTFGRTDGQTVVNSKSVRMLRSRTVNTIILPIGCNNDVMHVDSSATTTDDDVEWLWLAELETECARELHAERCKEDKSTLDENVASMNEKMDNMVQG